MIQVKIFYAHNDLRNFSYLIVDKADGSAWAIDPFDELPLIDYIKKESLVLKGILNTHQHWDHIKGNSALQKQFGCDIITAHQSKLTLHDSNTIQFMDTPGHTLDHQVFLWGKQDQTLGLFSGDTLFNSGVGNCRNGGNVEMLFETTQKLQTLPDEVVLYPGHDYILRNLQFAKTCEPENKAIDEALKYVADADTGRGVQWTLGQEKKVNPFLRLSSSEIRESVLRSELPLETPDQLERNLFKKLRSLRDQW